MFRRPPRSTRTDTLFPYTTLFRSEKVSLQIAEQMSAYLTSGAITNALNMPSLTAEEAKRLKPYMQLAEQLGSFAGQLTHTGLSQVTIEYEGQDRKSTRLNSSH